MRENVGLGSFIGETVALVLDGARPAAVYVAVVGGLAAIGMLFGLVEPTTTSFGFGFGFRIDSDDGLAPSLFELFSLIVSVVAGYLLLTRFLAARGRLRDGGNRFWPYLGMAILSGIAIVIGIILIIVPGVILLVRWAAASGFVIGAREGPIDALGASWRATKGHSWAIFFAGLIMAIGLAIGAVVLVAIIAFAGDTVVAIVSAFIEALAGAIFMAFGIGVYCLVHDDTAEMAEVFS